MKTIIRLGSRLEVERIREKYVCHFKNMSGDADHYEIVTKQVLTTEDIFNVIYLYATRWFMSNDDRYDDEKMVAAIEERGTKSGFEDPIDEYSNMVCYDVTSEGRWAMPDDMQVTYFTQNGVEYRVGFVIGDKVYTVIHEGNIKEILNV